MEHHEPELVGEADMARAEARYRLEKGYFPDATGVSYDASTGRIRIDFDNGAALLVPARSLQDLAGVSDDDLAKVEILGLGGAIEWPELDIQFQVQSLAAGIFGTVRYMNDLGKLGGMSKSSAKAAASRENGRKGGRPRKSVDSPKTDDSLR